MKKYNRIELKGNLGKDAQVREVGDRKVASFSVATEYVYKNKAGGYETETTWLNVCAWEGTGICNFSSLAKGAKVSVTGRLRSRTYTDQQGSQREILEVLADTLDLIYEPVAEKRDNAPRNAVEAPSRARVDNSPPRPVDDLPF